MKPADFERPITSPAIYQTRILTLEKELKAETDRREKAENDNIQLRDRIRGFESLTERLAAAYDALSEAIDSLTSRPSRIAR